MGAKENKELVQRIPQSFDVDDPAVFEQFLDENVVYRSTAGEEVYGRDSMLNFLQSYQDGFSDIKLEIEEIAAEGDKVFFVYRQTGIHDGEFWGISPTNNKMDILITAMVTVRNGKIVEQFDNFDTLELLKQLDALPKEAKTKMDELSNKMFEGRA